MKKTMKYLFMFVATLTMGMAVVACGSDSDNNNDNGGNGGGSSSSTIAIDGKNVGIQSVQLLQDGTDEEQMFWFVMTTAESNVLNIHVSKKEEGKTVDLSKVVEGDIADYWIIDYNVTQNYSMEAKCLMKGMGVDWGGTKFVFNQGSTLYFKTLGKNKYQLKFNINGPEYNNNSVQHSLVADWSGEVYNVASMLD